MNETTAVVEGGIKHWHPEIHFQLHEYVRYVRVSLTSGYSTDQYFESFRKMCEKAKIENFTVLEVYGTHDLVIRVFSRQMRSSLEALFHWIRSPHDTITATHAPVGDYRQCLHHWLWSQDGKTYPLPVDPELLQDIVQNSTEIETRLLEDFGLEVLEEKNALRIEAAPNPGIRFLVFISRASDPEKSMPNGAKEQYAKDVVQTVLAIDGITHEEICPSSDIYGQMIA